MVVWCRFIQAGYLSMLCYNFGVETFQEALYEHSVQWLRYGG